MRAITSCSKMASRGYSQNSSVVEPPTCYTVFSNSYSNEYNLGMKQEKVAFILFQHARHFDPDIPSSHPANSVVLVSSIFRLS